MKHFLIITLILTSLLITSLLVGCDSLRFAPTEAQKQIALQTHLNAVAVDRFGADPDTPATNQLAEGTSVQLNYTGMPANSNINDYPTTLAQANADSTKRPAVEDVFKAADEGLSLIAELAILFGVGGTGFAGKKLLDWIVIARQKSKALKEIIQANEIFKLQAKAESGEDALTHFKDAQNTKQSASTKVLVTELKS